MRTIDQITPGNWHVAVATIPSLGETPHICVGVPSEVMGPVGFKAIAVCGATGAPDEAESIANANLIGSSKELYCRLKQALPYLHKLQADGAQTAKPVSAMIAQVETALQNAEGVDLTTDAPKPAPTIAPARPTPEGCHLVAHSTGDGWALCVEDTEGEVLCYLAWPKSWPEQMTSSRLEHYGFTCI